MADLTPTLSRAGAAIEQETTYTGGITLPLTCPLTAGIAAGHQALAVMEEYLSANGATDYSLVDSKGNTWTRLGYYSNLSGMAYPSYLAVALWMATITTPLLVGDTLTLSCTQPVGDRGRALIVYDCTNVAPSSTLIGLQGIGGAYNDANPITTPPVGAAQSHVLVLAIGAWYTQVGGVDTHSPLPPTLSTYALDGTYDADAAGDLAGASYYAFGAPTDYWTIGNHLSVRHKLLADASGNYTATLTRTAGDVAPRVAVIALLRGAPNNPPTAPALAIRGNFTPSNPATFAWTFSDPNPGDSQSAYQLLIKRAADHGIVVDTGKVAGTAGSATVAGGTLSPNTTYEWQVRTWDQSDAVGPYSSLGTFSTFGPPTATITTPPTNGTVLASGSLTVAWSFASSAGLAQRSWQVRVWTASGQLYTSGEHASSDSSFTVPVGLANNTDYSVGVTVWDVAGSASAEAVRTFHTTYVPAQAATLTATPNDAAGTITLAVTLGDPAGTSPAIAIELYRRPASSATWTRLVRLDTNTNQTWIDHGCADEVLTIYKAVITGQNGAQAESPTVAAEIIIEGIFLHAVSDPAGTTHHFLYDNGERGDSLQPPVTLTQYAGRPAPVASFNATALPRTVQCFLTLPWDLAGRKSSDREALEALALRREPLCYRDHRSRVLYGVLAGGLQFDDIVLAYTTTVTLAGVDYQEGLVSESRGPRAGTLIASTSTQPLGPETPAVEVQIEADPDNAVPVIIGWSDVQTIELAPGQTEILPANSPSDIYARTDRGTARLNYLVTPVQG